MTARELAALRVLQPEQWHDRVRGALRSAGSIPAAAEALGVSTGTLYSWLRDVPSLRDGIDLPPPGNPVLVATRERPRHRRA